jgi:predicted MFS family arabinose efflux permease
MRVTPLCVEYGFENGVPDEQMGVSGSVSARTVRARTLVVCCVERAATPLPDVPFEHRKQMSSGGSATAELPRRVARRARVKLEHAVGGPARARVIVVFACVLGLESADLAAVGAAGPQLRSSLGISNAQLGLLAALSTAVGAIATVPFGALADRVRRVRLLSGAVALWGVAMLLSAVAQGYDWLLFSRIGLGAVTAAAGPAVASLTGDFFPASERAKIYGYILTGELLGAGFGFVVSGTIAGAISWRGAFAVLSIPAAVLAVVIWRGLPEPERGGQSPLAAPDDEDEEIARETIARERVSPIGEHVLREDPRRMPLRRAIAYVLRIKTNRWLIAASAIGYFFFAGMRTFAVLFIRRHFGLDQTTATVILFVVGLGALAGVLISGRLADRLIRRGRLDARVLLAAIAYIAASVLLLPSLLLGSLAIAVPLLMLASAAMAAPNPPLDAARLDVMPSRLWGRAEGVRTLVRQSAQTAAPLLFGLLADAFGGGTASIRAGEHIARGSAHGLQAAFLIMLVPLLISGVALLAARRCYPADVATAIASERDDVTDR